MIVGSAGHIDHGKTSLVGRLTGVDTDRLKEEKARGISIDLGFAYQPRPSGDIIGFVDVPGHEGLVHNMLAGATGIDFVMLVIAADDGVMPQTREHLAIVDLLGLSSGLIALNKCDLVSPERILEVTREIEDTLRETSLCGAEIVPVSAATGLGLDRLQATLDRAAGATKMRAHDGAFRLAVDRCFTLPGQGTVVTGTVLSGTVKVDDPVIVSPEGIEARVRSIHAQDRPASAGVAGQRCALVIAGAKVSRDSVHRGSVVVAPELHAPAHRIDVRLRVLASQQRPVGHWMPVRVHHAAAEAGGRVIVLRDTPILPGETEFAQLVLDRPIAAVCGDRFVVRDTTSSRTLGGGTIIDLRAPERRHRTAQRRLVLQALALTDVSEVLTAVLSGPGGWIELAGFMRDRGLSSAGIEALVAQLDLVSIPVSGQPVVMLRPVWNSFSSAICSALDAFHKAHPDLPGVGLETLRLQITPRLPVAIFGGVAQRLAQADEIRFDRAYIRRPAHEVRLSPQEEQLWARILPRLAGGQRFRPPRVRDIARELKTDEKAIRRIARLASRRGDVEEIAEDHYFLYDTVVEMAGIARDLADHEPQGFSVIQFRDRLDNGRKVAIQILEFFDRHGLTMRRGDVRRINVHRASLFSASHSPGELEIPNGGGPFPAGRADFKSGWGRQTVLSGIDSLPPPPPIPKEARS